MHTYKTLTLGEAHTILDAAQKKAEELGIPEVLCVADNAGYPIALGASTAARSPACRSP